MESGFASAVTLLFLILDPFGNMPIVAEALRRVPHQRRNWVVLRECSIAYCVLLVFMFFGKHLMGFLKLSQTSLGIAGGVVLFLISLRMIFPVPGGMFGEGDEGEPLIVPVAVPAIAGPSALAMVMLMASQEPRRILEWSAALTLAMLLTALLLLAANLLLERLGPRLVTAMERLMGLVLSVLAVEMLMQGIRDFVQTLSRSG